MRKMMTGKHPMSPFGNTEAVFDEEYWENRARRAEQELAEARAALLAIREYERGEDEQARAYGVLEPDKAGYCFGLADAALAAAPPPPGEGGT